MGSLARDTLAKACTSFRSRIEPLFTAEGSFIEYVDCQYVYLPIAFYFNKIGWFWAVLCHLKEIRKKSGFIAATLYISSFAISLGTAGLFKLPSQYKTYSPAKLGMMPNKKYSSRESVPSACFADQPIGGGTKNLTKSREENCRKVFCKTVNNYWVQ